MSDEKNKLSFRAVDAAGSSESLASDEAILDWLRKRETLTVAELAELLQVTATAVRQRLNRLLAKGYIERSAAKAGRGRPSHQYRLTAAGRRHGGSNFTDLAVVLWQELRRIEDPQVRRGLLARISQQLAVRYGDRVEGRTLAERMESLVELFGERRVPFEVDWSGELPVLTALACPYPELAEQDRSICAMERILFSEVLGENVRLDKCRLDGESCCTFEASSV